MLELGKGELPVGQATADAAVDLVEITAGDADIAAMTNLLRRGVRVGNEDSDGDRHLHEMIPKPWGREYRVYVDDFLDVWHLEIDPAQGTSMHAHPRKTTYLLCLSGVGRTTTLSGATDISSGTILRIARGAFHSTENVAPGDPLMLIEVETPRNKYDLMRLRDGYQRAGKGYEQTTSDVDIAQKKVAFLPNARMCRLSPCGAFAFSIYSGMDVHYRRRSVGSYLVPLGIAEIISDQMTILTDRPDDERRPNLDCYYLGIQRVA